MLQKRRLLIVDDDPLFAETLSRRLSRLLPNTILSTAYNVIGAEALVEAESYDAIIMDLSLDQSGVESGFCLLRYFNLALPRVRVIVLTSHGAERFGMRAVELGASSFIEKPGSSEQLAALVHDAFRQNQIIERITRNQISKREWLASYILGESSVISAVREQVLFAARSRQVVHIVGEAGVGKSLVVQCLLKLSSVGTLEVSKINCCLPKEQVISQIESFVSQHNSGLELRGSKTIVIENVESLIIEDLKLGMAIRQLVSLITNSLSQRSSEVRLILTYNASSGGFRDAAKVVTKIGFESLSGLLLHIPPLRQRLEDLPVIVGHFLDQINESTFNAIERLEPEVLTAFEAYNWPGNVRELRELLSQVSINACSRGARAISRQDLLNSSVLSK
jgi:DNA-binding NtrC family response regulator